MRFALFAEVSGQPSHLQLRVRWLATVDIISHLAPLPYRAVTTGWTCSKLLYGKYPSVEVTTSVMRLGRKTSYSMEDERKPQGS